MLCLIVSLLIVYEAYAEKLVGLTFDIGARDAVLSGSHRFHKGGRRFRADTRSGSSRYALQESAPAPGNAIVSVNTATGNTTVLFHLPEDVIVTETSLDPKANILYLWYNQALHPYDIKAGEMLPSVVVDVSQCEGGSGCFDEFKWDAEHERIVAVGMGFSGPHNTLVSIDVKTGTVESISPFFSRECALYLQCSAFDSVGRNYFAWLACKDAPTASLYKIDLRSGHNTTLLTYGFRDVMGPMMHSTSTGLIGVGADGILYHVSESETNRTIPLSDGPLGGIPSMGGLTTSSTTGDIFASLVDLSRNKLAVLHGTARKEAKNYTKRLEELPYAVECLYLYPLP